MTWQASSFTLLTAVLVIGFLWYERRRPPARVVALVGVLAALAVVGRLAFAAIPNVKPTTDIVLFAGYALGPIPGFVVGAITALSSNVFLGQGPWTAWQMVGWGICGVGGALLARAAGGRELGRLPLALACGAAGLLFGAFMDVYQWTLAAQQDLASYLAISATSLPYNLAHAFGNVVFCLLIGPIFIRSLSRYRRRFEFSWAPPRPERAAVGVMAILAIAVSCAVSVAGDPGPARASEARAAAGDPIATSSASRPAGRAVAYLLRIQNRDGGFGSASGTSSSQLYTGWAALGLAAGGRNPYDVRRRGARSVVSYLRRSLGRLTDIGDVERTILVLVSAGAKPRSFGGRNLVGEVRRRRLANGSVADYVSYTAFGILALKAAGAPVWGSAISYLAQAQNSDGGFGIAPNVSSDTDMTGAVLQALAAVGEGGGGMAQRAVGYLTARQNRDGGFGTTEGRSSNAQSTAYAVQGLLAVGAAPRAVSRARRLLVRLQGRDGSVRYSRTSTQTPVWVTAQALAALRRKALPLATVPRRKRPRARGAAADTLAGAESAGEARAKASRRARPGGDGEAGAADEGPTATTASAEQLPNAIGTRQASALADTGDDEDGSNTAVVLGAAALMILIGMAPWRLRRR